MSKIRVLSVFGTRPEAVKMAPVVRALAHNELIDSKVCVTAQHREMLDQVLGLFDIQPDIDLNLMRENQSLSELTASIFTSFAPVLQEVKPDWVLVQGDTTTVMTTALVSFYHQVRVGHVEAGLRTGDKWQPFPEEINRRVAGVVADLHFAPTTHSRDNLLREGVDAGRVLVTGNPVIDALQTIANTPIPEEVDQYLKNWGVRSGNRKLVLITAHRRENFGQPLENICEAIRLLAEKYQEQLHFVYPVHLNPNVQKPVHRLLSDIENISLIPPLPYLLLVHLMKQSILVLTDSGGIQEEATALKIPTLVLRNVTERPEGVTAGVLKLVGSDVKAILDETCNLLDNEQAYQAVKNTQNPFGDGHAAERIVQALLDYRECFE